MIAVGRFPRIPFRKCQCWVVNDSVTRANVVLDVISREGLQDRAGVSASESILSGKTRGGQETYEDRV